MSEETRLEDYIEYVDYDEQTNELTITFKPLVQTGYDFLFLKNIETEIYYEDLLTISLDGTKTKDGEYFVLNDVPETLLKIIFICNGVLVKLSEDNFYLTFVPDELRYINLSQSSGYVPVGRTMQIDISDESCTFEISVAPLYLVDGDLDDTNAVVPKDVNEIFKIHNNKVYLDMKGGFIEKDKFTTYSGKTPINCVHLDGSLDIFNICSLIVSGEFPKEILNHLPLNSKVFPLVTTTSTGDISYLDEFSVRAQSINKAPLPFGIANN